MGAQQREQGRDDRRIPRYVIVGAGAVGAGLAAEFTRAGIDNVLVGRGEQLERIREAGLRYVRPDGERIVALATAEGLADARLAADDVVVIATKTQDVAALGAELAWQPVRGGDASQLRILTLQNGLATEATLLRWFGAVYGGSLNIPSRYTELGTVVSGAAPKVGSIVLGRAPRGVDAVAGSIAADLRAADYIVQLTDDVSRWKAAKLLHSVKNAVEVLRGEERERERLSELLVEEAELALAAAGWGVAKPRERTEDHEGFVIAKGSGIERGQQSTWQSFARGATSTEIDFLNGEVVTLGRLHGVDTPANAAVQRLLGIAARRGAGPGEHAVDDVLALIHAGDPAAAPEHGEAAQHGAASTTSHSAT